MDVADQVDDAYSRVLAEAEVSAAADAIAVAEAEYASVGLADRLRASVGVAVLVRVADRDQALTGTVTVVADRAVAVEDVARAAVWIVPFAAIAAISGLAGDHRRSADRVERRRSMAALLRPAAGSEVVLAVAGAEYRGRLQRVGSDHVQVLLGAVPTVVPLAALQWLRLPSAAGPQR